MRVAWLRLVSERVVETKVRDRRETSVIGFASFSRHQATDSPRDSQHYGVASL